MKEYTYSIEEFEKCFCYELYSEEYEEINENDVDNTSKV